MKFYNRIDEKGRFVELIAIPNQVGTISDTHTYSYLQCRESYKEMTSMMGLDYLLMKEEATLQFADMKEQYAIAQRQGYDKPFKVYVADVYCAPNSPLPELFRHRLQNGAV